MPSSIGHVIAGFSLGHAFRNKEQDYKYWIVIFLLSVIPDFDVFTTRYDIGLPLFSHRAFSHSLLFALLLSFLFVLVFYRKILTQKSMHALFVFIIVACSHPILDAMTTGGLGIGFFMPFNNNRYFLPWKMILVSPMSVGQFFNDRGWRVLKSELYYIGIPSLVLIIVASIFRIVLKKIIPGKASPLR